MNFSKNFFFQLEKRAHCVTWLIKKIFWKTKCCVFTQNSKNRKCFFFFSIKSKKKRKKNPICFSKKGFRCQMFQNTVLSTLMSLNYLAYKFSTTAHNATDPLILDFEFWFFEIFLTKNFREVKSRPIFICEILYRLIISIFLKSKAIWPPKNTKKCPIYIMKLFSGDLRMV